MTKQAFYPYRVIQDVHVNVTVDGEDDVVDPNTRRIRLWERPASSWRVDLVATVDRELVQEVVPDSERDEPHLDVVASLVSNSSRFRRAYTAEWSPDRTAVSLPIEMDDVRGDIDVSVVVTRRTDVTTEDPTRATHRGAVVAVAPRFVIEVDEPARRGVDTLDVRWEGFEESTIPWLQHHAGDHFALVSKGQASPPALYLNSDISRLGAVLDSTSTTGSRARVRDAVYSIIAHQTWTSMVSAALCELKDTVTEADADTVEEALQILPLWMAHLLRDWAPTLYPDETRGEALTELWEAVVAGQWEDLVVDRLPNAVSTRTRSGDAVERLIRELEL